jgi:hypothetical protein
MPDDGIAEHIVGDVREFVESQERFRRGEWDGKGAVRGVLGVQGWAGDCH